MSDERTTAGARARLVPTRDALALASLAVLVLLAFCWSILGEVRVSVGGVGILVDASALASAGGVDPSSARLAALDAPDLWLRRAQLQAELDTLVARDAAAEPLRARELAEAKASVERQIADADARIAALASLADRRREAEAQVARLRAEQLADELDRAEGIADTRDAWVRAATADPHLGATSPLDVATLSEAALEARRERNAAARALAELPVAIVDAEATGDVLLERLAEVRAERDARVAEGLALDRAEIERQSARALEAQRLRDQLAEVDLALARGGVQGTGEQVSSSDGALLAVVFLDASEAKRVTPGAEIRVAPDSVEKARFGSVLGTVLQVSERPVTPTQAEALLANGALADRLTGTGRAMVLVARLEPAADTASGLRWTTSRGPPAALTAGTTLTAAVTVERRRPITWFMPALRNLTGAGT